MKNVIKDIAAESAVAWGTIAEKIDENFEELEKSITEKENSENSNCVLTTKQVLSDEQKAQARENIGTVSASYIVSVFEELKRLIQDEDTEGVIAILDSAILDLSKLG